LGNGERTRTQKEWAGRVVNETNLLRLSSFDEFEELLAVELVAEPREKEVRLTERESRERHVRSSES